VNRQLTYCQDILFRIAMIQEFTTGGRTAFLESSVTQEAVMRCFEVIGEAIKRLDDELLVAHPEVPWSDYTGFRNFLIHQYDKVELPLVWDVVIRDLPILERAVQSIRGDLALR
jgi:uncharacterized protein with HEPN domain